MSETPTFTPREIVSELDRYVVGQRDAKRAVAIALRNRWRRQRVTGELRDEIAPKNIIMIGPTGVGKTEIARRLAKLAQAPFLKVEASKFTEVGYVGRDVESIVRDLADLAVQLVAEEEKRSVMAKARERAEERVLDALGTDARGASKAMRRRCATARLDEQELEVEAAAPAAAGPMPDAVGVHAAGRRGHGQPAPAAVREPARRRRREEAAAQGARRARGLRRGGGRRS